MINPMIRHSASVILFQERVYVAKKSYDHPNVRLRAAISVAPRLFHSGNHTPRFFPESISCFTSWNGLHELERVSRVGTSFIS